MGGYELNFKVDPTPEVVNYSGNYGINHDLDCTYNSIQEPLEPFESTKTNLNSDNSNNDLKDLKLASLDNDLKDSFLTLDVEPEEIEIVEISEKCECSIAIKIGDRNFKTLWDTGAGKCVISKDKYSSIPDKLKTELHPSNIIIKAAEGSIISNDGECEITFKIGPATFTFPLPSFKCSHTRCNFRLQFQESISHWYRLEQE